MAKKNLKSALASHNFRKAQKAHEEKVAAAQAQKAQSIKGGASAAALKKKRKRLAEADKAGSAAAAEADQLPTSITSKAMGKQKAVAPFQSDDTVLLVGEGDFSFTLALLCPPHSHSAKRILATSFDSEAACVKKYPNARANIEEIRRRAGGRDEAVRFQVDAGNLLADKVIKKWQSQAGGFSKIYFGFPHVGQGHKDEQRNVLANQLLLLRFLVSAAPLLTSGRKPSYAATVEQGSTGKRKRDDEDEGENDEDEIDQDQDPGEQEEEDQEDPGSLHDGQLESETTGEVVPVGNPAPVPRSPARAGSILITIRNVKPYTLWALPHLGTRLLKMLGPIAASAPALPKGMTSPTAKEVQRTLPRTTIPKSGKGTGTASAKAKEQGYDVWRSFKFTPSDWPGYRHVRTIGSEGREGGDLLNRSDKDGAETESECRTWEFGLRT